jgi:amino-acid N-acetyltransferase
MVLPPEPSMKPVIEPLPYGPAIEALLLSCGLPASDLGEASEARFFGCHEHGKLVGVVGLERCGDVALLRSLAVPEAARGIGLGRHLVSHAEREAAALGVQRLYLLTTTAAPFFERLGYVPASRTEAPASIAATAQFAGLCPASSTFMSKTLAGLHPGTGRAASGVTRQ